MRFPLQQRQYLAWWCRVLNVSDENLSTEVTVLQPVLELGRAGIDDSGVRDPMSAA